MSNMPSLPQNIKNMIFSIINQVSRVVNVSKVYLYGSYFKGTFNSQSDLDLAFFIPDNEENLYDAHRKILKIASKYDFDVQPQTFYLSEEGKKNGIVGEILNNGIEISKYMEK